LGRRRQALQRPGTSASEARHERHVELARQAVADNGAAFISARLRDFCKRLLHRLRHSLVRADLRSPASKRCTARHRNAPGGHWRVFDATESRTVI
jgi:hypothetical protein